MDTYRYIPEQLLLRKQQTELRKQEKQYTGAPTRYRLHSTPPALADKSQLTWLSQGLSLHRLSAK